MNPLRETPVDTPVATLRERLDEDGYLLVRRLFDPDAVLAVRAAVLAALNGVGWLVGDTADARPSSEARREEADPDPAFFDGYRAIQHLQAFHELAHHPSTVAFMEGLLGTPLLVHPRKIARIGLPADDLVVAPHQDLPLIGGTPDTLTCWVPLGACPDELGGLRVLAGSHHAGLRRVRPNLRVGGLELVDPVDDEPDWRTADFEPGDGLVFHSLTVHAAKPNRTDRLRLSVDFRYQCATDPVHPGSLVPHYHPVVPGHDELTKGWTSDAAVGAPTDISLAEPVDPFVGPAEPIRSRLVSL